ncbi:hypothetical protein C789_316 [Microcystis aeruginosa FACHB-905 = DIANCHI905]|nr:hypothetical protein C789_316 [Microcystis aeruginosa FACHB-905 = DIANCHI905]
MDVFYSRLCLTLINFSWREGKMGRLVIFLFNHYTFKPLS